MTSLLEENRIRLQQRLSQRLRGGFHQLHGRSDFQRRRRAEYGHVDPYKLQAQEYIFNNRELAEKYDISQIMKQVRYEQGEMMQLPMLRPRYMDMHQNKGVPSQKYIDMILNRKGPMHRAPSRKVNPAGLFPGKEYDDSISIKSYRNNDPFEPHAYQFQAKKREDEAIGKFLFIGPHNMRPKAQHSPKINQPNGRISSRDRPFRKEAGITTLKGKKLSSNIPTEDSNVNAPSKAPRNLSFLNKLRKRLSSRERKFVDNITAQTFLTESNLKDKFSLLPQKVEAKPSNRPAPLPPIRITVTNPMPDSQTAEVSDEQAEVDKTMENDEKNQMIMLEDRQKKLPLVKFSHPKTRKHVKKTKRKVRAVSSSRNYLSSNNKVHILTEETGFENETAERGNDEEDSSDRRQSQTDSLMPAPITKITFQSYHAANLRKPRKIVNNVQVERLVQRNVTAVQPLSPIKEPAVKVSTFEMEDNPNPDIIHKKDGTLGPAPPSSNYVNFQKATRQGGQSRLLLSLRNRTLAAEAGEALNNWGSEGLTGIYSKNGGFLGGPPFLPKVNDNVNTQRKLGGIRAMKRSLIAAHRALLEEDDGKIEIDTMTDEARSEKSFLSEMTTSVASIGKSYYINRIPETTHVPNQAPVAGFYMGRSQDEVDSMGGNTRTIGTQWTTDEKITAVTNTPLAPPNTALMKKAQLN